MGDAERHGRPFGQFTLWLGANLTIADFALGFLPISLGLSWPFTIVAIVVGNLAGSLLVGLCSAMGPTFGLPQLMISRFSFGRVGNLLPAFLNYVSTIGWFTVNTILGALGLRVLFPALTFWEGAVILVILQGVVAIYGHNLIHVYERVMSVVLGVLFAIATVIALTHAGTLAAWHPVTSGAWPLFAIMVASAFSYVGSWAPYASDYSRYMPPATSRRRVIAAAFAGSFFASAWLELVGAAVAVLAGAAAAADPISAFHAVMGGFGAVAVIAIVLGGTAADALNLYSNALCAGALGLRLPRWLLALIASVIGLVLSLLGSGRFEANYDNFLLMLGYWMTPWAGVLVADFFLKRRRSVSALRAGPVMRYGWAALVSFVVGIAVATPFMDGPFYEGPVSRAMGGADTSFYIGFAVALGLYTLLARGRGVEPEGEAASAN